MYTRGIHVIKPLFVFLLLICVLLQWPGKGAYLSQAPRKVEVKFFLFLDTRSFAVHSNLLLFTIIIHKGCRCLCFCGKRQAIIIISKLLCKVINSTEKSSTREGYGEVQQVKGVLRFSTGCSV